MRAALIANCLSRRQKEDQAASYPVGAAWRQPALTFWLRDRVAIQVRHGEYGGRGAGDNALSGGAGEMSRRRE